MVTVHDHDYQVGDRVRLICDLAAAPAGTEGVVAEVKRDDQEHIQTLVILISEDPQHTRGTGVFPQEVELVRRVDGRTRDSR